MITHCLRQERGFYRDTLLLMLPLVLQNLVTNFMALADTFMVGLLGNAEMAAVKILGGKTGYTEEAGLCLASLARINGREYIFVTAKADGNHYTKPYHVIDAENVYDQIRKNV